MKKKINKERGRRMDTTEVYCLWRNSRSCFVVVIKDDGSQHNRRFSWSRHNSQHEGVVIVVRVHHTAGDQLKRTSIGEHHLSVGIALGRQRLHSIEQYAQAQFNVHLSLVKGNDGGVQFVSVAV
ncbi:hypothetical protein TYRP_008482 [Tyrophagus putrescentiae]|nr:hypothetical protein TYRP_008482 [Tyrophagus putrescentiae]